MKILVTGRCRFIGHKVVQNFEKMNNEVEYIKDLISHV